MVYSGTSLVSKLGPFLQTVVILSDLGSRRLFAVLEREDEQLSLAAYNLLQVMFETLRQGLQKEVLHKDNVLTSGESPAAFLKLWG